MIFISFLSSELLNDASDLSGEAKVTNQWMNPNSTVSLLPHSFSLTIPHLLLFTTPVLFKVYCCDHTYTTIRVPVATSVREVIGAVADKLGSAEDLLLVNLSSAGGESSGGYMLTEMAQERARGCYTN